jgi:hypothetical protein
MGKTYDIPTIKISVNGGVADVVDKPQGIRVIIDDNDNRKEEEDYQPGIWEGDEEYENGHRIN